MQIVTWNVNSLKARKDYVTRFLDEVSPDVLCVQELKLETDKVPREIFESRGYHLAIHGQKQWNGVLIASKTPLTDVVCGFDGEEGQSRLVSARSNGVRLINLYCPQGQAEDSPKFAYKLRFFERLNAWVRENCAVDEPLVLTGDINIAPDPDDVWDLAAFENVPTYHPKEHEAWAELLAFGLKDVVKPLLEPHTYSFWDYRKARFRFNKGMRIDHHLLTAPLAERVTGAGVYRDWRKVKDELKASDHAPVWITLGGS